jgi:hypothetical protein
MGIKFAIGQQVKQVVPAAIVGEVTEAIIIGSEVHYKVDTIDPDGGHTARFFAEEQISALS